jgi:hypothetical protein
VKAIHVNKESTLSSYAQKCNNRTYQLPTTSPATGFSIVVATAFRKSGGVGLSSISVVQSANSVVRIFYCVDAQ